MGHRRAHAFLRASPGARPVCARARSRGRALHRLGSASAWHTGTPQPQPVPAPGSWPAHRKRRVHAAAPAVHVRKVGLGRRLRPLGPAGVGVDERALAHSRVAHDADVEQRPGQRGAGARESRPRGGAISARARGRAQALRAAERHVTERLRRSLRQAVQCPRRNERPAEHGSCFAAPGTRSGHGRSPTSCCTTRLPLRSATRSEINLEKLSSPAHGRRCSTSSTLHLIPNWGLIPRRCGLRPPVADLQIADGRLQRRLPTQART
jgi:hypothetical protein